MSEEKLFGKTSSAINFFFWDNKGFSSLLNEKPFVCVPFIFYNISLYRGGTGAEGSESKIDQFEFTESMPFLPSNLKGGISPNHEALKTNTSSLLSTWNSWKDKNDLGINALISPIWEHSFIGNKCTYFLALAISIVGVGPMSHCICYMLLMYCFFIFNSLFFFYVFVCVK